MHPKDALARDQFETPEIWGSVAADYTARVLPAFEFYAKQALARLPATGKRLLDLACGPGTLTVHAASGFDEVTAVDFSVEMLAQLQSRTRKLGLGNVSAHQMDGHELQLPNDYFNVVASMFGVVHFAEPGRGLREMWRVLKPGGSMAASTWAPPGESAMMGLVSEALRAAIEGLPDDHALFHTGRTPEQWCAEMTEAGFQQLNFELLRLPVEVPDPLPFWENMKQASVPVVLLRNAMTEEKWQQTEKEVLSYLRQAYAWPHKTHAAAYVFVGSKA